MGHQRRSNAGLFEWLLGASQPKHYNQANSSVRAKCALLPCARFPRRGGAPFRNHLPNHRSDRVVSDPNGCLPKHRNPFRSNRDQSKGWFLCAHRCGLPILNTETKATKSKHQTAARIAKPFHTRSQNWVPNQRLIDRNTHLMRCSVWCGVEGLQPSE